MSEVSAQTSQEPHVRIGVWSGAGLVIANMVGSGVLLSVGYMMQSLNVAQVIAAWVLGAVLASLGAVAYGWLASVSGRSGGEYRFLSDYLHPLLGYLSGWGSLFLGFAAPVAVDALAIGAFTAVIIPGVNVQAVALGSIVLVTAVHSLGRRESLAGQDGLVMFKIVVLMCLVGVGVVMGQTAWPTWSPPEPSTQTSEFLLQQYWIAFAFSGWNAAIYAAGEFKNPRIDPPRATIVGLAFVTALYLVLNIIFMCNLTPASASAVFNYEQEHVTLAQVLLSQLLGPVGGTVGSLLIVVLFVSAMSAMTYVGPRVYAEMANDGYLPAYFRSDGGRPPIGAVWLQGAVAALFVFTHGIREAVQSTSSLLMLFTALTVLCVFRTGERVPWAVAGAAVTYAVFMGWLLYLGLTTFGHVGWELAAVGVLATVGYVTSAKTQEIS